MNRNPIGLEIGLVKKWQTRSDNQHKVCNGRWNSLSYPWPVRKKKKSHIFIWYFVCKVNIWNVNDAWATSYIFDSRTNVRRKGLKREKGSFLRVVFCDKNISTKGGLNPQPSDSYRVIYHLILRSQTFAIPHFQILALVVEIFFAKWTFEMSTVYKIRLNFTRFPESLLKGCFPGWFNRNINLST